MDNIEIRKATLEDLDKITHLNYSLFEYESQFINSYEPTWPFSETGKNYFRSRIQNDSGILYVALMDGEIVAYISGSIFNNTTRKPQLMAEIENLIVKQEARGKGIGNMLMTEFTRIAQTRGCVRLKVVAVHANTLAREFYTGLGFHEHEVIYEKDIV